MKLFHPTYAAAAVVMALALPVNAAGTSDPAKMTCKDFAAMDSAGMMSAMTAMKDAAMKDKMADPAKMAMSDADMTKMVMDACKDKPDMMVMDSMRKTK